MKFRYILRNKHTNKIHKKVYTLNQIQKGGLSALFDIENYSILSTDLYTEKRDSEGVELFTSDFIDTPFGDDFLIDFVNGEFRCVHKPKCLAEVEGGPVFDILSDFEDFDICGNLIETPHLLED